MLGDPEVKECYPKPRQDTSGSCPREICDTSLISMWSQSSLSPITAFWSVFSLSTNADLPAWGSLGSGIPGGVHSFKTKSLVRKSLWVES